MSPANARLYWHCGGEILTGGGPFRATGSGRPSAFGCRAIGLLRATELWIFYRFRARDSTDPVARRHCRDCARELQTAIAEAADWRHAA